MNVDKGLIRHWANLCENMYDGSGEVTGESESLTLTDEKFKGFPAMVIDQIEIDERIFGRDSAKVIDRTCEVALDWLQRKTGKRLGGLDPKDVVLKWENDVHTLYDYVSLQYDSVSKYVGESGTKGGIGDLEPASEELDFVGDPDQEEQRTSSNVRNQMVSMADRVEFRDKLKKHGDISQDAMLTALAYMCIHGNRKKIQDTISKWADTNRKRFGSAVDEVAKSLRGYLSRVDAGDVEYRYSKNDVYEAEANGEDAETSVSGK